MSKSIWIELDDDHPFEDTVRHVADLVEQGYTSGIGPTWTIEEDD